MIVSYPRVEVRVRGGRYFAKHNSLHFRDYVSCHADSRKDLEGAVENAKKVVKGDVCSKAYLKSFAEELIRIGEENKLKNIRFVGVKNYQIW